MNRFTLCILLLVSFSNFSVAQSPEAFKYQAVIRDANNQIVANSTLGVQFIIRQGSTIGPIEYSETFTTVSNAYGLIDLSIGTGNSQFIFSSIDWSNGPYFLETLLDLNGGTNYVLFGSSEFLSVPYSLHSKVAESAIIDNVNDADSDTLNEIQTLSLNGLDLSISGTGGNTVTLPLDTTTGTRYSVGTYTSTQTSSSSFTDMAGMTTNFTSGNSPVMIQASIPGTYNSSTGAVGHYELIVDGVQTDLVIVQYVSISDVKQVNLKCIEQLSAGQHEVKVRWRALSGTLSAGWNQCHRQILVWE
ncbi:MAG: hypothetical protein NXI10_10190 [bacterium]|nr:hypothetical protein [bacterium]